ncbi:putative Nucleolar GTP-binding protein 1 [Giardia muris]|uniref:Nucleolar GTP-binding protein 1 n=1 Tax=Giardia muris TaxID=5742 RepID=A0A4Z1SZ78_GIAMU|nr:putative Nucleolar GTP-binding protein 1 [Giardia muris]|eukprot:TNJ26963.1 putative Nucleolar GTP-binding protein 1 [Giardia muris]
MPIYDFRAISTIPNGKDIVDIVLSKTQRRTPTVIRKTMKLSRIRSFYMLKVRFTQNTIDQKLTSITEEFPKIDEIHPFYRYWFNVIYDKDHFKIALGQLHQCKALVDKVGKHYVKLLKHADSLFQCKTLKRAALGRMISLLRKQGEYLEYLEQVRKHMGRLPVIDPSARTLLLTGYPSVGKSSLLNALTDANVEVASWDFTTQSLFVGHAEYKLLRYQIIDTPGLLDHPLEERNNIELQAITALAYLNAAILFLLDISYGGEHLQKQLRLFESMRPFFQSKPVIIILSKADIWTPDSLSPDIFERVQALSPNVPLASCLGLHSIPYLTTAEAERELAIGGEHAVAAERRLNEEHELRMRIVAQAAAGGPVFIPVSTQDMQGVERAMAVACEQLLQAREVQLLTDQKRERLEHRQFVAQPQPRDNKVRAPCIPDSVRRLQESHMQIRPLGREDGFISELDLERENGGPRVYKPDERKHWLLANDDWKYDQIPYFHNGKNILDFITVDEDIEERLRRLEEEEEGLLRLEGAYDDEALFKKLELFRELTDNRPLKKAPLRGVDLLYSSVNRIVRHKSMQNGRALDRMVREKTGHDFDKSVTHLVFKRMSGPMKEKQKTLQERMEEQSRRAGVSVEQMRQLDRDAKRESAAHYSYKAPAETAARHLMTGKMSLGTRNRR